MQTTCPPCSGSALVTQPTRSRKKRELRLQILFLDFKVLVRKPYFLSLSLSLSPIKLLLFSMEFSSPPPPPPTVTEIVSDSDATTAGSDQEQRTSSSSSLPRPVRLQRSDDDDALLSFFTETVRRLPEAIPAAELEHPSPAIRRYEVSWDQLFIAVITPAHARSMGWASYATFRHHVFRNATAPRRRLDEVQLGGFPPQGIRQNMDFIDPSARSTNPALVFHLTFILSWFRVLFHSSKTSYARRVQQTHSEWLHKLRNALSVCELRPDHHQIPISYTQRTREFVNGSWRVVLYTPPVPSSRRSGGDIVHNNNNNNNISNNRRTNPNPSTAAATAPTTTITAIQLGADPLLVEAVEETIRASAPTPAPPLPPAPLPPPAPFAPFYGVMRKRLTSLERDLEQELLPVLAKLASAFTEFMMASTSNENEVDEITPRLFHVIHTRFFRLFCRCHGMADTPIVDPDNNNSSNVPAHYACPICAGNVARVFGRCGHSLCFQCYSQFISRSNSSLLASATDSSADTAFGSCYVCRGRFESVQVDAHIDTAAVIQDVYFAASNRSERLARMELQDGIRITFL
jgi:hypothetical protein